MGNTAISSMPGDQAGHDIGLLRDAVALANHTYRQLCQFRQILVVPGSNSERDDDWHDAAIVSLAQRIDQHAVLALSRQPITPRTIHVIELCIATARECYSGSREATELARTVKNDGSGNALGTFAREELSTLDQALESTENNFARAIQALEKLDGKGAVEILTTLRGQEQNEAGKLRATFIRRSQGNRPVPALLHLVRICTCIDSFHHATNIICAHVKRCSLQAV